MTLRVVEASHGKSPPYLVQSHRPSAGRDIMYLICHMILQDHMIKGSCDFMSGIASQKVTRLPCLVATGLEKVAI